MANTDLSDLLWELPDVDGYSFTPMFMYPEVTIITAPNGAELTIGQLTDGKDGPGGYVWTIYPDGMDEAGEAGTFRSCSPDDVRAALHKFLNLPSS